VNWLRSRPLRCTAPAATRSVTFRAAPTISILFAMSAFIYRCPATGLGLHCRLLLQRVGGSQANGPRRASDASGPFFFQLVSRMAGGLPWQRRVDKKPAARRGLDIHVRASGALCAFTRPGIFGHIHLGGSEVVRVAQTAPSTATWAAPANAVAGTKIRWESLPIPVRLAKISAAQ
jgi:hypothetical protein